MCLVDSIRRIFMAHKRSPLPRQRKKKKKKKQEHTATNEYGPIVEKAFGTRSVAGIYWGQTLEIVDIFFIDSFLLFLLFILTIKNGRNGFAPCCFTYRMASKNNGPDGFVPLAPYRYKRGEAALFDAGRYSIKRYKKGNIIPHFYGLLG